MDDFDQLRLEPEHPRLGYYFNASRYFNVSSTMLSSIFSLPSRVLSRMHKMHDLYAQDPAFVGVATRNRARERVALYAGTASPDFPTLPTPWPFMTSGYVLMLALMVSDLLLSENPSVNACLGGPAEPYPQYRCSTSTRIAPPTTRTI